MKIPDLHTLEVPMILQLVQQKGVYLFSRQEPKFFIDRYRLDQYTVEIYTHHKQKKYQFIRICTDQNNPGPN